MIYFIHCTNHLLLCLLGARVQHPKIVNTEPPRYCVLLRDPLCKGLSQSWSALTSNTQLVPTSNHCTAPHKPKAETHNQLVISHTCKQTHNMLHPNVPCLMCTTGQTFGHLLTRCFFFSLKLLSTLYGHTEDIKHMTKT